MLYLLKSARILVQIMHGANLEHDLREYPLLKTDEQLLTMSLAAVQIGQYYLNAVSRTDSRLPLKAEKSGISLLSKADPGSVIHGKQFQKELSWDDLAKAGTYVLVHGVNGYDNYKKGLEFWDVSIASVGENKLQAGVVFVPEFDKLYYGKIGEGTYLNGHLLTDPLVQRPLRGVLIEVTDLFLIDTPDLRVARAVRAARKTILELKDKHQIEPRNIQSGGHSLGLVAEGRLDGYLSSWTGISNLPAGVVLCRARGMDVLTIEGNEWQPNILGVLVTHVPEFSEMAQRNYSAS